ncbi:unnamed protein product [Rhizopus stolonifer]
MTKTHNAYKKHSTRSTKKNNSVNPVQVLDSDVHAPDNYIITAEEANNPVDNNFSFFARVWSIPFIRNSAVKAQEIASHFAISRFMMNQAEATLKIALTLTSPYAEKYKSQLLKVDELGCHSLDLVESKMDPSTVMASPQKVYTDVKGRIMTFTNESVEQWINKYLPMEKDDVTMRSSPPFKNSTSLANEVKHRLVNRAKTDLARLIETNQLLQEMLHSVQNATDRLQEFVASLKGGYNSTQTRANARLHELMVDVIKRVDTITDYAKERHVVASLPSVVHPVFRFASNEYGIIRAEMLKSDIPPLKKATNILYVNQSYILPMIQHSTQELQRQIREYSLNNRVVREVKSTFGLANTKA